MRPEVPFFVFVVREPLIQDSLEKSNNKCSVSCIWFLTSIDQPVLHILDNFQKCMTFPGLCDKIQWQNQNVNEVDDRTREIARKENSRPDKEISRPLLGIYGQT